MCCIKDCLATVPGGFLIPDIMQIQFDSLEEAKQVRDHIKDILLVIEKKALKNELSLLLLDKIYTQAAEAGDAKN